MLRSAVTLWGVLLMLVWGSAPGLAQERTASVTINNATGATLVLEFVRDMNPPSFRVVTLRQGETQTVILAAGVNTLTVTAPYSSSNLRYSATSALSTGQSYNIAFTEADLGVRSISDDLRAGAGTQPSPTNTTAADVYAACNGLGAAAEIWFVYNPSNTMSRGVYHRAGDYLCRDDGRVAYTRGETLRHYYCSANYRDCVRDEGWDARLGPDPRYGEEHYEGRLRQTERRAFEWVVGDLADWAVIIYR